jgi:preprotein translocase subunit SecB
MKATLSPLQVKEFFFKKLKLEENPEGKERNNLYVDFNFVKASNGLLGVELTVKFNPRSKDALIKFESESITLFEIDQKLPEKQREKLLVINGLVISYGLIRGVVYQMCSVIPPSQRLLPSVNFKPLIEKKLGEKR